ncbi:PREDICTED: protein SPT2-like [Fragaria vesca subsp. vesca]|uniref:protein SPT2-like n=1 Tax=Fragaria vesca subsp. vesca TaxID=101020 RepID=UPI0002C36241|nr:PREDICTED: protein SPT2-like [Fragaria vesca subsp. vesca]
MGGADDADFLRIREILKERIRNEKKKALDSANDCSVDKKKIHKHRPFFGPSQHCIAPRLIDGKDALMQELKISSHDVMKVEIFDTVTESESSESETESGSANVAKPKESRDYSFLSKEDDKVGKDICVSKSSNDEQTPDSIQGGSTNLKSDELGRPPQVTMSGSQKPSSAKEGLVPSDTQKKAKSMADKLKSTMESKPSLEKSQSETKGRLRKTVEKVDDEVSDEDEDENEDEDEVDVSSIIQGLFRSIRKRPSTLDYDDRDDRVMVSSFADIEREERRSAKLARQEDEIEALRIEQEEKKERLSRAKKQKLLHKSTTE